MGQVTATGGASYFFIDSQGMQSIATHLLYYRLRLQEPGAPDRYGPVAAVPTPAPVPGLAVWPTVFSAELHVDGTRLGEDVQRLELLDAQGRVVYAQALPPGMRVATLSGQGLAAGLYLLRATTATQVQQQRVVRE